MVMLGIAEPKREVICSGKMLGALKYLTPALAEGIAIVGVRHSRKGGGSVTEAGAAVAPSRARRTRFIRCSLRGWDRTPE